MITDLDSPESISASTTENVFVKDLQMHHSRISRPIPLCYDSFDPTATNQSNHLQITHSPKVNMITNLNPRHIQKGVTTINNRHQDYKTNFRNPLNIDFFTGFISLIFYIQKPLTFQLEGRYPLPIDGLM